MSDDTRPGGANKDWVDPDRQAPQNAFDGEDTYSGQAYRIDREEAQAERDAALDTPHDRTGLVPPAPEDPDDFKAPGTSVPR